MGPGAEPWVGCEDQHLTDSAQYEGLHKDKKPHHQLPQPHQTIGNTWAREIEPDPHTSQAEIIMALMLMAITDPASLERWDSGSKSGLGILDSCSPNRKHTRRSVLESFFSHKASKQTKNAIIDHNSR